MAEKIKNTIFLTGATGLVGSYFLIKFLNSNYRVIALARNKNKKIAKERIIDVITFWNKDTLNKINNLVVLDGDITKNNLGLDNKSKELIKTQVEEIYHCAATTKFNLPLEEIRKINTFGTKNILEIALECKNLKKINHISTAYVCGNYKGIFKEKDLDLKQDFNTTYEQSKFEAEKLIHEYRKNGLWIDIFRPPIIIGDSKSGRTVMFKMAFYQVIHYWSLEIFDIFPAKGIYINIIPVDILIEAISKISANTTDINQTYHPFPNQTISLDEFLDKASKIIGFRKPQTIYFNELDINKLTTAQRLLLQNNVSLFNPHLKLNSTYTTNILKKYEFVFPAITDEMLLKILKYPFEVGFKEKSFN